MSINVFLSKKLPKKKDNLISIISFKNEISYFDNVLSTGLSSFGDEDFYEIWEVNDKVDHTKFNNINVSTSKNYIFASSIIHNFISYEDLQLKIRDQYNDFFKIAKRNNMTIVKIWHYVPDLLKKYSNKKTNYSLLCESREDIYKKYYKDLSYPAATVIGIDGGKVLIYFLAVSCKNYKVIENIRQVSSYDYPQNIFIEKPMFSRAVKFLPLKETNEKIVISGTASIKGYESMHSNNLMKQLNEALENYKTFVDIENNKSNICRVYLSKAQESNSHSIVNELDKIFDINRYLLLKGDICRKELLIELEGISDA